MGGINFTLRGMVEGHCGLGGKKKDFLILITFSVDNERRVTSVRSFQFFDYWVVLIRPLKHETFKSSLEDCFEYLIINKQIARSD